MKHRKLFPDDPTELTNSTTECADGFCDPSCPDKCYPYSDYYFLPPPPPPTSPSPPPPRLFHHLSLNYVIITVALLASFLFLLVCYYVIIAKSCPGWCSLRNRRRPAPPEDSSDDEEGFIGDQNHGDHHVWFITTTGLQQSVINSIAVCKYKKGEGLIEGTECSVCLAEFQQDETLRLLPKCSHAFHLSCIDTWLRSHTNCPLCRACIVSGSISASASVPVDQNPDTLMEDSHIERDLRNAQDTDDGNEDRTALEGLTEIVQPDDDEIYPSKDVANNNLQPMSRSLLIDSAEAANTFLVNPDHSPSASEGSSVAMSESTGNTITSTSSNEGDDSSSPGSSSTVQCLGKIPVAMQRSVSCGGRFFDSRQSQSTNSVLHL